MAQNVYLPDVDEALALKELFTNWEQTDNYIKTFRQEKEQLGITYEECQENVRAEMARLREILETREEILLKSLQMRFTERDNRIEEQIDSLETHLSNNEETENKCKSLIATMQERSDRKDRIEKVVSLCKGCVDSSPKLFLIPIDLKFDYPHQSSVQKSLEEYGKLRFKDVASGKPRQFTGKRYDVSHSDITIGNEPSMQIAKTPTNAKKSNSYNKSYNNNNSNNSSSKLRSPNGKREEMMSSSSSRVNDDEKQNSYGEMVEDDMEIDEPAGNGGGGGGGAGPGAAGGSGSGGGDDMYGGIKAAKIKVSMDIFDSNGNELKKNKSVTLKYEPEKNKNDYSSMDSLLNPAKAGIAVKIKGLKKQDISDDQVSISVNDNEIRCAQDIVDFIGKAGDCNVRVTYTPQ